MEAEDLREAELEAAEDIVNSTVAQTLSEEAIQTRELFQTITSVFRSRKIPWHLC